MIGRYSDDAKQRVTAAGRGEHHRAHAQPFLDLYLFFFGVMEIGIAAENHTDRVGSGIRGSKGDGQEAE